ncbi:MAG: hypothetical protein EOP04_04525 [Proteobacteria bacterium]|nr:MAG: hypothetical protein EOP04_04525 [Pseudomonadota bacterium]
MASKAIVTRSLIDIAAKEHSCRANAKHKILKGDKRLKIIEGRSRLHYCRECGEKIIALGIARLEQLKMFEPES